MQGNTHWSKGFSFARNKYELRIWIAKGKWPLLSVVYFPSSTSVNCVVSLPPQDLNHDNWDIWCYSVPPALQCSHSEFFHFQTGGHCYQLSHSEPATYSRKFENLKCRMKRETIKIRELENMYWSIYTQ